MVYFSSACFFISYLVTHLVLLLKHLESACYSNLAFLLNAFLDCFTNCFKFVFQSTKPSKNAYILLLRSIFDTPAQNSLSNSMKPNDAFYCLNHLTNHYVINHIMQSCHAKLSQMQQSSANHKL